MSAITKLVGSLLGPRAEAQDRFVRDHSNRVIHAFSSADEIDQIAVWDVLRALVLSLHYIYEADVDGDVVEFGTMSGLTATRIAKAMALLENKNPSAATRRLFLFDSFEGLPEATADADKTAIHVRKGVWGAGTCKVLSQHELMERCAREFDRSRIRIHAGWFSDTVSLLPDETKIAMMHVDCDLYQSTLDALSPCFARGLVSEGAAICFDDWNPNRASPRHGERRAWAELTSQFEIVASDYGPYSWGGHKFLIHSYKGIRP